MKSISTQGVLNLQRPLVDRNSTVSLVFHHEDSDSATSMTRHRVMRNAPRARSYSRRVSAAAATRTRVGRSTARGEAGAKAGQLPYSMPDITPLMRNIDTE